MHVKVTMTRFTSSLYLDIEKGFVWKEVTPQWESKNLAFKSVLK